MVSRRYWKCLALTPELLRFQLLPDEVKFTAIRAQGAGGQNVNKVSSAIHLRFDIAASSLPQPIRERLLQLNDQRIVRLRPHRIAEGS